MSKIDTALKPLMRLPNMDSTVYSEVTQNVGELLKDEKRRSYETMWRILRERGKTPEEILESAQAIVQNALEAFAQPPQEQESHE